MRLGSGAEGVGSRASGGSRPKRPRLLRAWLGSAPSLARELSRITRRLSGTNARDPGQLRVARLRAWPRRPPLESASHWCAARSSRGCSTRTESDGRRAAPTVVSSSLVTSRPPECSRGPSTGAHARACCSSMWLRYVRDFASEYGCCARGRQPGHDAFARMAAGFGGLATRAPQLPSTRSVCVLWRRPQPRRRARAPRPPRREAALTRELGECWRGMQAATERSPRSTLGVAREHRPGDERTATVKVNPATGRRRPTHPRASKPSAGAAGRAPRDHAARVPVHHATFVDVHHSAARRKRRMRPRPPTLAEDIIALPSRRLLIERTPHGASLPACGWRGHGTRCASLSTLTKVFSALRHTHELLRAPCAPAVPRDNCPRGSPYCIAFTRRTMVEQPPSR